MEIPAPLLKRLCMLAIEYEDSIADDGDEFFDISNLAGDNIDDAYEIGRSHGESELACEIVVALGIDCEQVLRS